MWSTIYSAEVSDTLQFHSESSVFLSSSQCQYVDLFVETNTISKLTNTHTEKEVCEEFVTAAFYLTVNMDEHGSRGKHG